MLKPSVVVAKKPIGTHLQELKAELEEMLADVNSILAFVETNPAAAEKLIKVILNRGLGKK